MPRQSRGIIRCYARKDNMRQVKNEADNQRAKAKKRAMKDTIAIMESKKMYVNEKKYLTEVVENLADWGYYDNNQTIFEYIDYK